MFLTIPNRFYVLIVNGCTESIDSMLLMFHILWLLSFRFLYIFFFEKVLLFKYLVLSYYHWHWTIEIVHTIAVWHVSINFRFSSFFYFLRHFTIVKENNNNSYLGWTVVRHIESKNKNTKNKLKILTSSFYWLHILTEN